MKIAQYERAVVEALKVEGKQIEKEYNGTTKNWKAKDKPSFKKKLFKKRSRIINATSVTTGDTPFVFIDKGTSKRWAVMSQGFQAKTAPGRITSRQGRGQAVVRGRRAMQAKNIAARPGIKARKFSKQIATKRKKPFATNIQRAINRAAKDTF